MCRDWVGLRFNRVQFALTWVFHIFNGCVGVGVGLCVLDFNGYWDPMSEQCLVQGQRYWKLRSVNQLSTVMIHAVPSMNGMEYTTAVPFFSCSLCKHRSTSDMLLCCSCSCRDIYTTPSVPRSQKLHTCSQEVETEITYKLASLQLSSHLDPQIPSNSLRSWPTDPSYPPRSLQTSLPIPFLPTLLDSRYLLTPNTLSFPLYLF